MAENRPPERSGPSERGLCKYSQHSQKNRRHAGEGSGRSGTTPVQASGAGEEHHGPQLPDYHETLAAMVKVSGAAFAGLVAPAAANAALNGLKAVAAATDPRRTTASGSRPAARPRAAGDPLDRPPAADAKGTDQKNPADLRNQPLPQEVAAELLDTLYKYNPTLIDKLAESGFFTPDQLDGIAEWFRRDREDCDCETAAGEWEEVPKTPKAPETPEAPGDQQE